MEIKLTPTERLILSNQFRILSQLNPDAAFEHYESSAVILENGYEGDYHTVFSHIDLKAVDASITSKVRTILNMFRDINNAISTIKPTYDVSNLTFKGFDSHKYPNHYLYADFLINKLNLYREQKNVNLNGFDSIFAMDKYEKLLAVYNLIDNKINLTELDIKSLLKVLE